MPGEDNFAERCFSLILFIHSMMSFGEENILDPLKVESESAKGVRKLLKKRKLEGDRDEGVYLLLIAKLKENETKADSEKRVKQCLNNINNQVKRTDVNGGRGNDENSDSTQSGRLDCEPEPKKAKMAEETKPKDHDDAIEDFVIPVYVGETGTASGRFKNHKAIKMFFERYYEHYEERNYGLFLWLAPNPKILARYKEGLLLENYDFVLNHSENDGTRIDKDTPVDEDPIIRSEGRDRTVIQLREEEMQKLQELLRDLDRGREVFRTINTNR